VQPTFGTPQGIENLGLPSAAKYRVRDLWTTKETESTGELRATVPIHSVVAYRIWLV
jgi:alpha-galactosidase